jgi:hypothetical protein
MAYRTIEVTADSRVTLEAALNRKTPIGARVVSIVPSAFQVQGEVGVVTSYLVVIDD